MPDTLVTLAQPPQQPAAAAPQDLCGHIWSEADYIDSATREAGTALKLVWEVMEELCGVVLDAEAAGNKLPLERHDQLYLLTNLISDRVKAVRRHGKAITEAVKALRADPAAAREETAVALLWGKLLIAEQAINNPPVAGVDPSEEVADAYHAAHDRFIAEPAITPADVLLKLERAYEVDSVEKELAANPGLAGARLLKGAIHDLRAMLAQPAQVS